MSDPGWSTAAPVLDDASPEVVASTALVLDAVRTGGCTSRPAIVDRTGLGKALVNQRVRALLEWGVLIEGGQLASSGGRPAQRIQVAAELGYVVGVEIGMTHVQASVADLSGSMMSSHRRAVEMRDGPEKVLEVVEALVEQVVRDRAGTGGGVLCGIGTGVAGPVEFATGRTVHPPVTPDWHNQPIRDRLAARFAVPTWVDNEVNLMALAEVRQGAARGHDNALVFKLGSWVGAGLISNGRLHRGAQGCAGSLVTTAGGESIARQATRLASTGRSPMLAQVETRDGLITAQTVADCAERGDAASQALLDAAAEDIGKVMAVVIDFFNPSLVVVAGGVTHGGDAFLAKIRQTVYGSGLALATRDLQIVRSTLDERAGVLGAALMTLDEIFAVDRLPGTLARVTARAAGHGESR